MKVLIHHFDENAMAILRYGKVKVVGVYDERVELQGKDAGELIGLGKTGLKIYPSFNRMLREKKADTVVTTGEGKYFTNSRNALEWRLNITQAIGLGLNIFTMSKVLYGKETEELKDMAKRAKVKFQEASDPDGWKKYLPYAVKAQVEGLKVPRILFAGTSMNSGKITTMMAVKEYLEEKGIKVGTVGTEPCSTFLGIDEMVVPEVYPTSRGAAAILGAIKKLEEKKPKVILVGSQTGLTASSTDVREARAGAVVAWQILYGSQPNKIVLCSKWDKLKEIGPHMRLLKETSSGKVVANTLNGRDSKPKQLEKAIADAEKEFHIPCMDVLRGGDLDRLVKTLKPFKQV